MLASNALVWGASLLVLSLTPYLMKVLNYGPLMALAVAIATLCILTDGVATLLVKKLSGSELNPIMNLLFRKVGLHRALLMTRMAGLALIVYGVLTENPYMILGISWLFLLAGFVGLSSIALARLEFFSSPSLSTEEAD